MQFKYFKLTIASMYFYGNFIRENNDANGKNNKDRTALHQLRPQLGVLQQGEEVMRSQGLHSPSGLSQAAEDCL